MGVGRMTARLARIEEVPPDLLALKYEGKKLDRFAHVVASNPSAWHAIVFDGEDGPVGMAILVELQIDSALHIDTLVTRPDARNGTLVARIVKSMDPIMRAMAHSAGLSKVRWGTEHPKAYERLIPEARYVETLLEVDV